ncbi:hypothetical protein SCOCK_10315 [Actinacidiphila cocklensis]|uniref:Uncharacterized protein n=1 Tax=Actinacidiphila cocklensis TaxID=887465 RepID=A0A9W4DIG1_9ACTN|nr:hypothetical protein SCOCK_10315 [Actinacidiphila cocklensis]
MIGGWLVGLAVVAAATWAFQLWRSVTGRPPAQVSDGLEPGLDSPPPGTVPPARRLRTARVHRPPPCRSASGGSRPELTAMSPLPAGGAAWREGVAGGRRDQRVAMWAQTASCIW